MKKTLLSCLFTLTCALPLWTADPFVSNVRASQRTDGSILVDVYYLTGDTNGRYDIVLQLTHDGGNTLEDVVKTVSGDVDGVSP